MPILAVNTKLLDSPVLLNSSSNILASPTTGAIPAQRFDWKQATELTASQLEDSRAADGGFNDFSFHTANSNARPTQTASFPAFKVERSLADGRITQIMYKGAPNYPKLLSTRRYSSGSAAVAEDPQAASVLSQAATGCGLKHFGATPENSSVTFGDDEAENASQRSDGDEPDAKRR